MCSAAAMLRKRVKYNTDRDDGLRARVNDDYQLGKSYRDSSVIISCESHCTMASALIYIITVSYRCLFRGATSGKGIMYSQSTYSTVWKTLRVFYEQTSCSTSPGDWPAWDGVFFFSFRFPFQKRKKKMHFRISLQQNITRDYPQR